MSDQASNILEGDTNRQPPILTDGGGVFEDATLVQKVRTGDMQAFALLVTKYQDRIFNMLLRMCPQRAEAEELAQETFLKALERIGQFRGTSKFYTWLFRIAANLAISHRRRSGRVRFQSLTGSEEMKGTQAEHLTASVAQRRQVSPPDAAMAKETVLRVEQALEEIDDEFRLVVILRDMEDMDYAAISEVVAIPVGTVKSRLHRARIMLREKLTDLIEM